MKLRLAGPALASLALLGAALARPATADPGYTIVNTGIPTGGGNGGYMNSIATGINDNGQVVGTASTQGGSSSQTASWLWTAGAGLTKIIEAYRDYARDINNNGRVVGDSRLGVFTPVSAFVWTAAEGRRILPPLPGHSEAAAGAVNDNDQVAGTSGGQRATLWDGGSPVDLGTLGGGRSSAAAINSQGQVAGSSLDGGGAQRAFLWSDADDNGVSDPGEMQSLGVLPGHTRSYANAVNDAGQVVGYAETTPSQQRAFLWDSETGMTDLGVLPGYTASRALAINNNGLVVGTLRSSSVPPRSESFFWSAHTGMVSLSSLLPAGSGWTNLIAGGINDRGQIVGYGTYQGRQQGFVMTPVNQPPTIRITEPGDGALFEAPADITICAVAGDSDGTIRKVEFFAGDGASDSKIGEVTAAPYGVTWAAVPVGSYRLTAVATDDQGATASSAVDVTVNVFLRPTADAFVRDGAYADANYGRARRLIVKTAGAGNNRDAYLKFDISGAPDTIRRAVLSFSAGLSRAGARAVEVSVHAVADTGWTERGLTWNNKPSLGSALGSVRVLSTTYAWYEVDVTDYVRAQKAAGQTVISLGLHNAAVSTPGINVNARETSLWPELTVR